MENKSRRDGRPVEEIGYYNPISKQCFFNSAKVNKWLECGAQPTTTVVNLLKKNKIIS
jgi:small subunit ribosomal protein S16